MKITLYGHGCIVTVTLDEERFGVAYDGAGTLYEYVGVGCWNDRDRPRFTWLNTGA